ncbi:hypothetical protein WDH52_22625 [Streptomyces sp. TRM70308]|uniref:hypothetical protein n=1 Tax=Streptomyces sp. TRM70308 TaxID=3131932 RepID=UPI003D05D5B3
MAAGVLLPLWGAAVLGAGVAVAASFLVDRGKRRGCLLTSLPLLVTLAVLPLAVLLAG